MCSRSLLNQAIEFNNTYEVILFGHAEVDELLTRLW